MLKLLLTPAPDLTAFSMLSFGIFAAFARSMMRSSREFSTGSDPPSVVMETTNT